MSGGPFAPEDPKYSQPKESSLLPSTVTTVVAARVPNDEVLAFRRQAARYGLTPSKALAALVAATLAIERETEAADESERSGE
jgi:hypothetical protein